MTVNTELPEMRHSELELGELKYEDVIKYREDIDGLRGFSVLGVVLFHLSSTWLPGGYVGVDIFFVISGFLITSLILMEVQRGRFTFRGFYRRRAIRLLPALLITLAATTLFAVIAYSPEQLDLYGKQLLYSALGFGNILSAQGVNYFSGDIAALPLLHLWSLGVEEQFYFVWPTFLLFLARFRASITPVAFVLITLVSLGFSVNAIDSDPQGAYFLPQYRAFELTLGAIVAVGLTYQKANTRASSKLWNHVISVIGLTLMVASMFLLDESSSFPGINAAIPCVGAALFLWSPVSAIGNKLIATRPLVLVGLISYPFYLLHLPLLSAASQLGYGGDLWVNITLIIIFALPASWLIFHFLEQPLRRLARRRDKGENVKSPVNIRIFAMASCLFVFAVIGTALAKLQGLPDRFERINPFAQELIDDRRRPFFGQYASGVQMGERKSESILLFGDSLMQDYAPALIKALEVEPEAVNLITKGGCAFLKNIEFQHYTDATECESLRETVYSLDATWDTVVFTQGWAGHEGRILNAPVGTDKDSVERWQPFIDATLEHFLTRSKRIIIIGNHPKIDNIQQLTPTLFTSQAGYVKALKNLKVINEEMLDESHDFFESYAKEPNVIVIHPTDIWRTSEGWKLYGNQRSYFHDAFHLTIESVDYVEQQIRKLLMPAD